MRGMIYFTKMHGLGNDFILFNGFDQSLPDNLGRFAAFVCDRHFGLGADGVIVLQPPLTASAEALFRIFNADGSEAVMCGNGLRCAANFARRNNIASSDEFAFDIMGGNAVQAQIIEPAEGIVTVNMGVPRLHPSQIPTTLGGEKIIGAPLQVDGQEYVVTLVSMGNPHCVVFVDHVLDFPVQRIGPLIETSPLFPEKINVEFVQLLGNGRIRMRVWERGCGETLACGSGACAATVAAILNGYLLGGAEVLLAHGSLLIKWKDNGSVCMTGPSAFVAEGKLYVNNYYDHDGGHRE